MCVYLYVYICGHFRPSLPPTRVLIPTPKHPQQEAVRKKAVMALQRFHSLHPQSIAHLDGAIRRALCDKDPSVMAATLCLLLDLIKCVTPGVLAGCIHTPTPQTNQLITHASPMLTNREDPQPYRDLVPSFVSILKQVVDQRLPRDYDYHRVPAPWVQVREIYIICIIHYKYIYVCVCVCVCVFSNGWGQATCDTSFLCALSYMSIYELNITFIC